MATSGSIDFSLNRDAAITEALELVGALGEGEAPTSDQLSSVGRTMNMMLKAWQAKHGVNLFAIQKLYVFLAKNQHEYSLNSSTTDHFSTSYVKTTLDGAHASGETSLTVDSIAGISDGDYIGVELTDGTLYWDIVDGAPSGSTVTITTGLSGAASDAGVVFAYTTKANRPMKITDAVRRNTSDIDVPVNIISREEYVRHSNKTSDGVVVDLYFDPQRTTSKINVWPEPSDVTNVLVLWVVRTLDDLDAASDEVDYPQEWYWAIATNLAVMISPKYGVPDQTFKKLRTLAMESLMDAESFDTEDEFKIEPEYIGR